MYGGKPRSSPLRHKHHLWKKDLFQMLLHRFVEQARIIGMRSSWEKSIAGKIVSLPGEAERSSTSRFLV